MYSIHGTDSGKHSGCAGGVDIYGFDGAESAVTRIDEEMAALPETEREDWTWTVRRRDGLERRG